ncbi:MAG: hypothetical protein ACJ8FY_15220 [Gemmataceae bacterium]
MLYKVVVHETIELVYEIEADSAEEAKEIWEETLGDELGEPDEECLGCELVDVCDDAWQSCEI